MKEETPLYQRVLSALIVEDETEGLEENSGGRNMPFQYSRDHSPGATSFLVDSDSRKRDRVEFEYNSMAVHQDHRQLAVDRPSCNGSTTINGGANIQNQLYHSNFSNGGGGHMHTENRIFPGFSENGTKGAQALHANALGICSSEWKYEQICLGDKLMLELQSIGLCLDAVVSLIYKNIMCMELLVLFLNHVKRFVISSLIIVLYFFFRFWSENAVKFPRFTAVFIVYLCFLSKRKGKTRRGKKMQLKLI